MLTAAVVHEKAGNGFIHTVCSDFMPLKKTQQQKKTIIVHVFILNAQFFPYLGKGL